MKYIKYDFFSAKTLASIIITVADIIFSLDMAAKDENHHHVIRREKGSKLNHIKLIT